MDKKFIISISGKDFVLHEGLLNEFFENGGETISTKLVDSTGGIYIFKATATGAKGEFTGHGDACDKNVNPMIVKHKIRMAETRAVNRALRFYNNIGMCSVDELGGEATLDEVEGAKRQKAAPLLAKTCISCGKTFKTKLSYADKCKDCYFNNKTNPISND